MYLLWKVPLQLSFQIVSYLKAQLLGRWMILNGTPTFFYHSEECFSFEEIGVWRKNWNNVVGRPHKWWWKKHCKVLDKGITVRDERWDLNSLCYRQLCNDEIHDEICFRLW